MSAQIEEIKLTASFNALRNDLYWKVFASPDGTIRWTGYDDDFWWDNVSKSNGFRTQVGKVTGRRFYLDPHSNEVTVYAADQVQA